MQRDLTPLLVPRDLTVLERPEIRLLPSKEMEPLDRYMARAHVAWARRYRPWLLAEVA